MYAHQGDKDARHAIVIALCEQGNTGESKR